MKRIFSTGVIAWLLLAASACSDKTPTAPDTQNHDSEVPGLVISESLVRPANITAGLITPSISAATPVTYISAAPGTLPGALVVTIRNETTDAGETLANVIDGGFDPVAIAAVTGDKLALTARKADGESISLTTTVPPRRPPIVVRTNPAKGRIDVALTQVITAVFSEPLDLSTVNDVSIQLLSGGQKVSAGITTTDGGLSVNLIPTSPLQPQTEYSLVIGRQIRDLKGDQLDSAEIVTFTTAAASTPPDLPLGKIVFQRLDGQPGDSTWHVYTMSLDGSNVQPLTTGPSNDRDPAVSPDGTKIAFVRDGEIYVMNIDGSDPRGLSARGAEPCWSPDGRQIAFTDKGSTGISVIGSDGTGLVHLTDRSLADKIDIQPAWSPDGRQIAFMRAESIADSLDFSVVYVMNADGTGVTRLGRREESGGPFGSGGIWASWGPVWSPDSQRIAFAGPDDGLRMTIFSMRRDGSDVAYMATMLHGMYVERLSDWSPDGQSIAVSMSVLAGSSNQGPHDIYLLHGSILIPLTTDGHSSSASFVPK